MKEIKITEIENIRIGSAENKEAGTGCTVIICERGGSRTGCAWGRPGLQGIGAFKAHGGS